MLLQVQVHLRSRLPVMSDDEFSNPMSSAGLEGDGTDNNDNNHQQSAEEIKTLQSLLTESLFGMKMPEVDIDLELSDVELRQKCGGLLHPKARPRIYYNMMHAIILMYYIYTVPLRIAFEPELKPWEATLDILIDLLIWVDIFINFVSFYVRAPWMSGCFPTCFTTASDIATAV